MQCLCAVLRDNHHLRYIAKNYFLEIIKNLFKNHYNNSNGTSLANDSVIRKAFVSSKQNPFELKNKNGSYLQGLSQQI